MRAVVAAWSIVRHPAFWLPILLALGVDSYVYGNHFNAAAIGSDGWGYYLHLPAIFIYGDPHLAFLNQASLPPDIVQYRFADGSWQACQSMATDISISIRLGPLSCSFRFSLLRLP